MKRIVRLVFDVPVEDESTEERKYVLAELSRSIGSTAAINIRHNSRALNALGVRVLGVAGVSAEDMPADHVLDLGDSRGSIR